MSAGVHTEYVQVCNSGQNKIEKYLKINKLWLINYTY